MGILEQAAAHAKRVYPAGDFPHIMEVVAYAQQLAQRTGADEEIVTLAAYFHDISSASMGPQEHNIRSAQMARDWLEQLDYPEARVERVAAAIAAHMRPVTGTERDSLPLECRILYDADKISRAQGLGIVGALVRLGEQVPWEKLSYGQLAAAVRMGRDATEQAYSSLYTDAARELAGPGHQCALAFCDSLLQLQVFMAS